MRLLRPLVPILRQSSSSGLTPALFPTSRRRHQHLVQLSRLLFASASQRGIVRKPFLLADIGEGITECEIVKWLVEPNQVIEEFDPIVEVMSDKATVEITSPFKGKVVNLAGQAGDVLKVGNKLCEVEVEDVNVTDDDLGLLPSSTSPSQQSATTTAPHPARSGSSAVPVSAEGVETSSSSFSPRKGGATLATPATRRLAREADIDLADVRGTGKDGRVTKGDVMAFVANGKSDSTPEKDSFSVFHSSSPPPAASASSPPATTTRLPLTPVRKAMFRAMTSSLQIPHFAYTETLDITNLERFRKEINKNIPLTHRKTLRDKDQVDRITLLSLLIKGLSQALKEHPLFLCTLESGGDGGEPTLVRRSSHDISIALSGAEGGLYTPVIPSVETLSYLDIAGKIALLQSSAPKFPPAHRGSGTITLSNVGVIGGRGTHPVIPPTGQLVIGAIGRTRVVPVFENEERAKTAALEGEGVELSVVPKLMMDVSFSADHRVVEGVELARLVETWKRLVENPERLLGGAR
ncbi:CoA-dependent acyltransferase [Meredithblackwellia eburnea MCA 4105]